MSWRTEYHRIPIHMMGALVRYRDSHVPVGDFLQAVICNDLKNAVGMADDTNIKIIPIYVNWFYNEVPSPAWGSREAYKAWVGQRFTPADREEFLLDQRNHEDAGDREP